ncbi:MAG TPA: hypothetical protein VG736_12905 [Vicinamibacterales bacterium]|nr:hypothetical protein [Vicinamibacterales bacterium]
MVPSSNGFLGRPDNLGGTMLRVSLRIAIAVVLIAAGWFAGRASTVDVPFRLTVDAVDGATLKCDGCRFLTWPNGHAEPVQSLTIECHPGTTCTKVLGAIVAKEQPKQIARAN